MNTTMNVLNTFNIGKVTDMVRGGELELLRALQPFSGDLNQVFVAIRGQLHMIKNMAVRGRRFKIACNKFGNTCTTLTEPEVPSKLESACGTKVSLWRPSQTCHCDDYDGMCMIDRLELLDGRNPGTGVEFMQESTCLADAQCMIEAITFFRAGIQIIRCSGMIFMIKCPCSYMSANRHCPMPYLREADQITLVHVSLSSIFYERIGSHGMFDTLSDAAEAAGGYDSYSVEIDTRYVIRTTGYRIRAAVINGDKLDHRSPMLRPVNVLTDMLPTNFVGVNYSHFDPTGDLMRVSGSEGMPTVHFATVAKGMHALAVIPDSNPTKSYVKHCVDAIEAHSRVVEKAGSLFREYLTRKTVIHNESRFAPGGSEYTKLLSTSAAAAVMRNKRKVDEM